MRLREFARGLALAVVLSDCLFTFSAPSPAFAAAQKARKPENSAFRSFIESLWPAASARGVSRETFDAAFAGVTFDPSVVANTNAQAEFVRPIWQYLQSADSPQRVAAGRVKAEVESKWLDKAQSDYGVDKRIILGVWGLETGFGAFQGSNSVIRALASLAFVHYRGDYFRDELLAALTILEDGDIDAAKMKGSWAGAMGQTQFMPSSFLKYAVDFTGEGRRDIWNSPADAIGSTANYLAKHGWIPGLAWGMEVRLPQDFDLTAADSERPQPFHDFKARGVRRADGNNLPAEGEGELLMPVGLKGPIFLITANFKAIKAYNNSTSYALGVALLGDAVFAGETVRAPWPVRERPLGLTQLKVLQAKLAAMGYDVGEIDGRLGEQLRAAVRAYQEKNGLPPDGYPTQALLDMLVGKSKDHRAHTT